MRAIQRPRLKETAIAAGEVTFVEPANASGEWHRSRAEV